MGGPTREKAIFEAALDIASPDQRAAYVKEACGDDTRLAERVLALLKASESASGFLPGTPREPPAEDPATEPICSDEEVGAIIGHYRLVQRLGEGGFGIVFLAQQLAPVKRQVALKIIKPGMDTKQVIGRFESERQALALMSHPNIAQVFDAGTTDQGRPYFVMEWVRGSPITHFCRAQNLDAEARLRLFMDVCLAVQHAHQKGIIHRDLKPSNILVTAHGDKAVPKVIDFGIAKAMEQPLTDHTVFTEFRQFLGTPAYVSPEQASLSRVDVDTRSDIYSLGVLLYELVTGSPPFTNEELLSAGLDEMRRIIREKDPERPSTRLRRTGSLTPSPHPVRPSPFASDLDSIVLKALEKDRDRRYATANGLSQDIRRYLAHEPVLARPPSAVYRFRKYVRRHRAEAIAAGIIAGVLSAGIVVSTTLAVRAHRSERRALIEAATSAAVAEFYWKDLLKQLSPGDFTNRFVTLRQALDVAEERAPIRLADQPLAEATVRLGLGAAYTRLLDYDRARAHLERAVELRRQHLGENDPLVAEALLALADNCHFRGEAASALANFTRAREIRERVFGPRDPEAIRARLGETFFRAPSLPYADATNAFAELAALAEEVRGPNEIFSRVALNYRALACWDHGDLDTAAGLLEESHRRALIDEGPEGGNALLCETRLASLRAQQRRWAESEALFRGVLAVRTRNYGPAQPLTLADLRGLVTSVLLPQQRYADTLDVLEAQVELCLLEPEVEWDWRPEIQRLLTTLEQRLDQAEASDTLPNGGEFAARLERLKARIGAHLDR